jgi:hypothetical protein
MINFTGGGELFAVGLDVTVFAASVVRRSRRRPREGGHRSGRHRVRLEDRLRTDLRRPSTTGTSSWGRCCDHNFLRFLPIFGEKKLAFFSKNNVMIKFLQKLAAKTRCFGENISKIKISVPDDFFFKKLPRM